LTQPDENEPLTSTAHFSDHASATVTRKGKIVGFDESVGRGRAAHGNADDSGRITVQPSGVPPHGEDGTLNTCARLVDQLNAGHGESWGSPVEVCGVRHIDAEVTGVGPFDGRKMTVQVVRALTDPSFWQTLGYHGQVTASLSLKDAAIVLKKAIETKVSKIPSEIRKSVTLVLDATDVPGLSLDPVVDEFNMRYSEWVEAQGFNGVWVAGPWREMVSRLGARAGS
jgi:hypothetical protein